MTEETVHPSSLVVICKALSLSKLKLRLKSMASLLVPCFRNFLFQKNQFEIFHIKVVVKKTRKIKFMTLELSIIHDNAYK